ncbi:MAG: tetratricopeptide repeat protein, partial [Actinobacteria bacterium]|nr:tetratricopeptide repeat protein [Actinomycetota bacterium]
DRPARQWEDRGPRPGGPRTGGADRGDRPARQWEDRGPRPGGPRTGGADRGDRPARQWEDRGPRPGGPGRPRREEPPTRPVPRREDGSVGRPIGKPQRRPVGRRERTGEDGTIERTEFNPQADREALDANREVWIDEGSVRDAAQGATYRGRSEPTDRDGRTQRSPRAFVADDSEQTDRPTPKPSAGVTPLRARTLNERVEAAQGALDRERFGDARRMVTPVIREAPDMTSAQEILGLAQYRLGNWRQAAVALEAYRTYGGGVENHPVLADCYRAMRKYGPIDALWEELKTASPSAGLVAEGRIVVAGAKADQGDIEGAIDLLRSSERAPAKVRDHHLRLWYVLADLYDRSGDVTKARSLFARILANDPEFADVAERMRQLGR